MISGMIHIKVCIVTQILTKVERLTLYFLHLVNADAVSALKLLLLQLPVKMITENLQKSTNAFCILQQSSAKVCQGSKYLHFWADGMPPGPYRSR